MCIKSVYNDFMTGRTHDLTAFGALVLVLATQEIPQVSLATAVVGLGATMIGGLAPDLDEPTAKLWKKLPAGSIFSQIVKPLLGGHRMISHSLLGIFVIGQVVNWILARVGTVVLVDMDIVWWAFMIGYVSHLLIDTITKEGVPWFFPIPLKIGFPPIKSLRITTGEMAEKAIIFPGLMVGIGYLIYQNYGKFLSLLTSLAK